MAADLRIVEQQLVLDSPDIAATVASNEEDNNSYFQNLNKRTVMMIH